MKLGDFAAKLDIAMRDLDAGARSGMNRVTGRHLERYVDNLPVGRSPTSPEAREQAARRPVTKVGDDYVSEVHNTAPYAGYLEEGHRQGAVGRVIFIELREGITTAYGQVARRNKKTGKWGIFLRLKSPYVRGNYAMRNSEMIAQKELDRLAARLLKRLQEALS